MTTVILIIASILSKLFSTLVRALGARQSHIILFTTPIPTDAYSGLRQII